jgi:hypothetical protein
MQQRNGGNWSVPCKNFASQAATASAATAHPVESYNLDAEGNRVASHRSAFHLTEPANRLVEDEQHVYEIDADGLQIRKTVKSTGQTWRYAYNPFDQLDFAREYATAASTTVMRKRPTNDMGANRFPLDEGRFAKRRYGVGFS